MLLLDAVDGLSDATLCSLAAEGMMQVNTAEQTVLFT